MVRLGCHELPKSPIITEITKKLTEITTKRTEITGTSCRYMFTGFKNVTFITVSNLRMILSKNMWKNTKKPEVAILFLLDAVFTPDIKQLDSADIIKINVFLKELFHWLV